MSVNNITVTKNSDVAEIELHDLPDKPGIAAELFTLISKEGHNVELVISSPGIGLKANISFAVKRESLDELLGLLQTMQPEIGFRDITTKEDISLITIHTSLNTKPGPTTRIFTALQNGKIDIHSISTSLSAITCTVPHAQLDKAETILKNEFGLS